MVRIHPCCGINHIPCTVSSAKLSEKEGATLTFICRFLNFSINLVSLDHLQANPMEFLQTTNNGPLMIKLWLFLWFTMSFCAIGAGITIMAVKYPNMYLGWVVLLQPVVVFISALLWLFSRRAPQLEADDMIM
jgi:hypothetical protein